MWNAVDDLIIRATNFHSLIELYGHFTEPHPVFRIASFEYRTAHPIGAFADHVSHFEHCSVYFPEQHLVDLFGKSFGTSSFTDLVKILRGYRFDIRCNDTNVAIPPGKYMVAYPFTLPVRKQMNYAYAKPSLNTDSETE
jgi:DNA (cytosine-5)-methyltransferase 1